MKSATQRWFGAVASNCRSSRFGAIALGLATLGGPWVAKLLSFSSETTASGWSRAAILISIVGIEKVVQKLAHAPAQLFDVKERGFLREGYWADLAMIDDRALTVRREDVLSKCGWSPFEGMSFRSRVRATWVNGKLVWNGEQLLGTPVGMRLQFAR